MVFKRSLRFKVVIAVLIIILPLVSILFYNNYYAMDVVQQQVVGSSNSFMTSHVRQIDRVLNETRKYMGRMMDEDFNMTSIAFYAPDSLDYAVSKQQLIRRFNNDIAYYSEIDTIFSYFPKSGELILATSGKYADRLEQVEMSLQTFIDQSVINYNTEWVITELGVDKCLIKVVNLNTNIYMGAVVKIDKLMQPLQYMDIDTMGSTMILSGDGKLLASSALSPSKFMLVQKIHEKLEQNSQTVIDPSDKKRYIVVGVKSQTSNLKFVSIIPRETMMKSLIFFQRVIYFIPIASIIVVIIYLLVIQKIFFRPLMTLMKGIRKIAIGNLNVRLEQTNSNELSVLIEAFNHMVSQIENLKIDVYEEQIKAQKAEFKHLQVQINPHFYFNSLNMISNLVTIGEYDLCHRMVKYLSDYFRFITKTNITTITLNEEIAHISNYLGIQEMMYPHRLTVDVHFPDLYADSLVPPLIVQPFVENAIIHGLMKQSEHFNIVILVETVDNELGQFLKIIIRDNGNGFNDEKLVELQSGQYLLQSDDKHLGIWNVHHRLKIFFNEEASLSFRNMPCQGAEVMLTIPIMMRRPKNV